VTTPVHHSTNQYIPRRDIREWPEFDRLLRDNSDVSKTTTISALLITILFHGALIMSLPWGFGEMREKQAARPPPAPEYTIEPLTAEDIKYVEANPDAPAAKPQVTPNVSDRNQQAAQRTPDLTSASDTPQVKGEQEETAKIVTGDTRPATSGAPPSRLSRPSPPTHPTQATPPAPKLPQAVQKPQPPTPPTPVKQPTPATPPPPAPEAYQGKPDATQEPGEGVNVAEKPVESKTEKPSDSKTTLEAPPTEKPTALTLASVQETAPPQVQPAPPMPPTPPSPASPDSEPTPMPRREVQTRVPAGPLMNNPNGTNNVGEMAISSNFSNFGNYENRMYDAISAQWNDLADRYPFTGADVGTRVVVVFALDQQGNVVACQVVSSSASRGATLLCTQAILSRSPFGPWTKDMADLLGETQNVKITFWYR
jgi:outer membrane biosynthesis protein TonB